MDRQVKHVRKYRKHQYGSARRLTRKEVKELTDCVQRARLGVVIKPIRLKEKSHDEKDILYFGSTRCN